MTRVTVIGTGYLGATHAACMAELGHEVLGMDVDAEKIALLAEGRVPFYEPGLDELLRENVAAGRLRFTTSYAEVAAFGGAERADTVHFICVNTPQQKGAYAADLSYVESVVDGLAPLLDTPALIVGKSTVPAGTAARLRGRVAALAPAGAGIELAWNPEFLREGFAVQDTLKPDRLVVGVASRQAEDALRGVYAPIIADGCPFIVTDLATAELVKQAANTFLATKISFINAMAEICEAVGADALQLAEALGHDARIGRRFLTPGLGFGGGCLPKDIRAFIASSEAAGSGDSVRFIREVDAINQRRRTRMVAIAREECGGSFTGRRVAVWGAAFKPDSDDVRDSAALAVAAAIQAEGAEVTVYDPKASANAAKIFPQLAIAPSAELAADGADVLLHLTEWREFREVDPAALGVRVAQRRIVDGRAALDREAWTAAGWSFRAPGQP